MSYVAAAYASHEAIVAEVLKKAGGTNHRIIGTYISADGRLTIHHVRFLTEFELTAVVVNGRFIHQWIDVSAPVYSPDGQHVAYMATAVEDPNMEEGDSHPPQTWVYVDGHHTCTYPNVVDLGFTSLGAFVTLTSDGAVMRIPTPEIPTQPFQTP